MIERLYSRLDLQLATLSAVLIVSGLLSTLLGFTPLLRFSFTTFLYGLLGGVILVVSEIVFAYQTNKKKKRWSLESHFSLKTISTVALARVLIQAAGEETLLRGFIFAPLVNMFSFLGSTLIALILNALISTGIYSTRQNINYFAGIHSTILAIIYLSTHSIFAVVTARFIGEITLLLASDYKIPHLISRRFSYDTKQPI